jgi:hypothetical protein
LNVGNDIVGKKEEESEKKFWHKFMGQKNGGVCNENKSSGLHSGKKLTKCGVKGKRLFHAFRYTILQDTHIGHTCFTIGHNKRTFFRKTRVVQ